MFMQAEGQIGTINPVFAGYAAQQLQEATGGIDRVFDNLLEIARGNEPSANGYDRLRATRVLYDRGFGKVTKNTPRTPTQGSERPQKSEESNNHTNHSSDNNRPVSIPSAPTASTSPSGRSSESRPTSAPTAGSCRAFSSSRKTPHHEVWQKWQIGGRFNSKLAILAQSWLSFDGWQKWQKWQVF